MGKGRESAYWLGFDLGGTKMLAALFDARFRLLGSQRKKTKAREGKQAGLERMVKVTRAALDEAGIADGALGGIGIGAPGPLDLVTGTVRQTPNLGWRNVPLKAYLEKAFGCPVLVANDVDAGVYGEYRFGAARGARCAVGIFPGTGIGGGCVYLGRLLRGKRPSCFEVGHMRIASDGPLCGCGQRGCLESLASRLAISAEAAKAVCRGEAPRLAAIAGTDLGAIRSGQLAQAVAEGDAVVEAIVRRAARHVGGAAASLVNLLAPDVVVLGGGLVEAMPELFVEEVSATAQDGVMRPFRDTFRVVAAALGDRATVLGAAALASEPGALE